MVGTRALLVMFFMLVASLPAAAQHAAVDDMAKAHVAAGGYSAVDAAMLERSLADRVRAPEDGAADVSAIEASLLLVDLYEDLRPQEEFSPRLRYVVRFGRETVDGIDVSFVDVERYNLGPSIRQDTIDAYGEDNTAEPEAFGIGPHVAWRFVTQPTAKSSAFLLAAGRREISAAEAAGSNCLPRPCLSPEPLDGLAEWRDAEDIAFADVATAYAVAVPGTEGGETEEAEPAALAAYLGLAAGLAEMDGPAAGRHLAWDIPGRQGPASRAPHIVLLIDRNAGQETMSDAALGIAKLDKDTDERWVRLSGGMMSGAFQGFLQEADGGLSLPPAE